jgi:hypothetical protein
MHDPIAIELDDDGKWIVFRRTLCEQNGDYARGLLGLPLRFTLADVCEAALATGLVVERNHQLFLDAATGCKTLAVYIDRMLGYFDRSDSPGKELERVIQHVRSRFDAEETLSLWCFAWLDLIVREDIADAARNEADPWRTDRLDLDIAKARDRRVGQVMESRRQQSAATGRLLATSERSRRGDNQPNEKTG